MRNCLDPGLPARVSGLSGITPFDHSAAADPAVYRGATRTGLDISFGAVILAEMPSLLIRHTGMRIGE